LKKGERGLWPAAAWKAGGCAARGGRLEVRGAPDRWVPPVGEREREVRGGGALVGRVGRKRGGRRGLDGPSAGKKKKREKEKEEGGLGRGREMGWVFFPILFKSFSNPFEFKAFTSFQIQIFNTNFSSYSKGFSQTIFNNFSNIF
jgi:hypothetical protein